MTTYMVDIDSMLDTSAELNAAMEQIREAIENLNRQVDAFLEASGGQAPAAYGEAQGHWNSALGRMEAQLGGGAQAAANIGRVYDGADTEAGNMFGGLGM